jgi:ribosomal protein S27AE
MAVAAPRSSPRVLNLGAGPPEDGLQREWDTCPDCGQPRWQLVIVPDRFHCDRCEKATRGPNREAPAPDPLDVGSDFGGANEGEESAPIDESQGWETDAEPVA